MYKFTQRLSAFAQRASLDERGIVQNIQLPKFRIGLWAIESQSHPDMALGVTAILAWLLHQLRDSDVYYLPVSVDDPAYSELTENIAIFGELARSENSWSLTIDLENELTDSTQQRQYQSTDIPSLVAALPVIASDIADKIDAKLSAISAEIAYATADLSGVSEAFLEAIFKCEHALFQILLTEETEHHESLASNVAQMVEQADHVGEFGRWASAVVLSRVLSPVIDADISAFMPHVERLAAHNDTQIALILAPALFSTDQENKAFEILESAIEQNPDSEQAQLMLIELYRRGQHVQDMLDAVQTAIEKEVKHEQFYLQYAALLLGFRQSGVAALRKFVFIDPQQKHNDLIVAEANKAYEAILSEKPDHIEALYRSVLLLIDADDAALWERFSALVSHDHVGEFTRTAVDAMQALEDVSEGISILEAEIEKYPKRYDLRVNLAILLLQEGEDDLAITQLEEAEDLTDDETAITDIEYLFLQASDPEFEFTLGNIIDTLNSGRSISKSDIEFLEDALEEAPTFSQGYLLLAIAYQRNNDNGAALEVLLDGQKRLPDDVDISEQLARLLWNNGERDLAYQYLKNALSYNQTHLPLLALIGRFLAEDGQDDEAKLFLAQAESINPQHPALREARRFIASIND